MSLHHVKYLLIGGGAAASSAAQVIRQHDAEGSVLLVGGEVNRPYDRPMLSKGFLRRERNKTDLYTLPAGWFADNAVQLRTGRRVVRLDVARDTATLDSGEDVTYDRALVATGGTATPLAIPGANLPNLFYLRTIEDAERLHTAIDKAKREGRPHARGRGKAVVVGGGWLGVEVAASLLACGLDVSLVGRGPHLWDKFAGETTGRFLARYLEQAGAHVYPDTPARRLEGDGRVQRVILAPPAAGTAPDGSATANASGGLATAGAGEALDRSSGTLDADFVVAAVGMTAQKELARGTPLAAENAILVDERCGTSHPHVYAAGDCCAILDPRFGKHRTVDHAAHAVVTGRIAGANMAGGDERYDVVTAYTTEVTGLKATAWGEPRLVHHRLVRGTPRVEVPDFVEIGVAADGRVAQVISVGHTGEDEALRDLVARRLRVDGNEERLKDPAVSFREILAGAGH